MINVHPQRWSDEFVPWLSELVRQRIKNVVKRLIVHRRDAENAKKRDIFLSADPRGIGAAFHPDETDERFHRAGRAGRPERKKDTF